MLRDDKDAALNAALVACRKSADHRSQAVKLAHRSGWTGTFQRLTRLCSAYADRIESLVRRFECLPREPDQDRQDISRLVTLTRAAVAEDNQKQNDRAQFDQRIGCLQATLLGYDFCLVFLPPSASAGSLTASTTFSEQAAAASRKRSARC